MFGEARVMSAQCGFLPELHLCQTTHQSIKSGEITRKDYLESRHFWRVISECQITFFKFNEKTVNELNSLYTSSVSWNI